MLRIASLFGDEQCVLNRLWIVLLGVQAFLVLVGAISVVLQSFVRRPRKRVTFALDLSSSAGMHITPPTKV